MYRNKSNSIYAKLLEIDKKENNEKNDNLVITDDCYAYMMKCVCYLYDHNNNTNVITNNADCDTLDDQATMNTNDTNNNNDTSDDQVTTNAKNVDNDTSTLEYQTKTRKERCIELFKDACKKDQLISMRY